MLQDCSKLNNVCMHVFSELKSSTLCMYISFWAPPIFLPNASYPGDFPTQNIFLPSPKKGQNSQKTKNSKNKNISEINFRKISEKVFFSKYSKKNFQTFFQKIGTSNPWVGKKLGLKNRQGRRRNF